MEIMENWKFVAYGVSSLFGLYGVYLAGKGMIYVGLSAAAVVLLESSSVK